MCVYVYRICSDVKEKIVLHDTVGVHVISTFFFDNYLWKTFSQRKDRVN